MLLSHGHITGHNLRCKPSGFLSCWPDGLELSRILSGIQRAAQSVLGVYLKRTYSRATSASSTLGILNDYALYKSTHSLTLPGITVA